MSSRFFLGSLACASVLAVLPAVPATTRTADDDVSFAGTVLPVLRARCFECHGPARRRPKGGLRMNGIAGLLKGGHGGPALVPGDPDASAMMDAVRWVDEDLRMPPEEKLPESEIDILRSWIAAGAEWPEDVSATEDSPGFSGEDVRFFEERVQPVLAENCFECHGPEVESPESGFRMSGRAAFLAGGDSGPAIVPGNPTESLLVRAIRYGEARKMPPTGKLPPDAIEVLERWVELRAPWTPGDEGPTVEVAEHEIDVEGGRTWWAFRPIGRPEVPEVRHAHLVASPIDAFVFAGLEEAGLEPNPPADRRELLRRLTFDLVGLPPTFEETVEFVASEDPRASARVVDDLLARPEYGERWARHWLDVVRYSQTNGYETDFEKPFAWRYRDWVIDAFNEDLPYDRFLEFQLAGDELDLVTPDSLVATGLYRLGPWDREPADPVEAEFDELDDNLRTISEGMLGVTLGCARCHDHKFDPFRQEDYYSLLAFLRSIDRYEEPLFRLDSAVLTPLDTTKERIADWRAEWRLEKQEVNRQLRALKEGGREGLEDVEKPLAIYIASTMLAKSFQGDLPWALTVRDAGPEPRATHLLARGRASSPGREVEPRFPSVLVPDDTAAAPPPASSMGSHSTGRRRLLAEWIASPRNPLTARVIVNRVWHHHFGRGIVATTNDFGKTGTPPTHPELLDWLATAFMENGWSLKWLHREILSSYVWRMSSRATNADALAVDPTNRLFWRQNPQRLEAEAIRDSMLAVSGELRLDFEGRGFFPSLSREALAGMSKPGSGWGRSSEPDRGFRGVYAYAKRGLPIPLFAVLDAPSACLPTGERPVTTSAPQALILINGEFVNRQAAALSERVAHEAGPDRERRIERAFELAFARRPEPHEAELLLEYFRAQSAAFGTSHRSMAFEPRVPIRLDFEYLDKLDGEGVLHGPRDAWTFLMGAWGTGYNSTVQMDRSRSAAAVLDDPSFEDGVVEARIRLKPDCELASLVVRGHAQEEVLCGLELAFLSSEGAVELRRLNDAESEPEVLAREAIDIDPEHAYSVRIEVDGRSVRAEIDGSVSIEAEDPGPVRTGRLGVRVFGGGALVETLSLTIDGVRHEIRSDDPRSAELRALEQVCLLILNANEFVYVD